MQLYFRNRVYTSLGFIVGLFVLSYVVSWLYYVAWMVLLLLFVLGLFEFFRLKKYLSNISFSRNVHDKLALGDLQRINYHLRNENYSANITASLVDEFPYQFQYRTPVKADFILEENASEIEYPAQPLERGVYEFGDIHLFIKVSFPGLLEMRKTKSSKKEVAVLPSFIQMKKYDLMIFSKTAQYAGIRRVRELGESDEFEHIKPYVSGDNIKSINWRATSRKGELMVNRYENSKSQMVYILVDKGRSMKMPFEGLTLLDYAINTTLVLSNVVLKKYDKAGLVTFSDRIGSILTAESHAHQLQKINQHLYKQQTDFNESNIELLYQVVLNKITRRSILFMITNFETLEDFRRNLNYLRAINKKHLLIVIMFVNTELDDVKYRETNYVYDVYFKTFAQKYAYDKEKIAKEMRSHGIQVVLTKPENLSINVLNKYLEIKARRMR